MSDPTEQVRREMAISINSHPQPKELLEKEFGEGNVWTTTELTAEFEVLGFFAPYCVVKRKRDGVKGSVEFQHSPRIYFKFREDVA